MRGGKNEQCQGPWIAFNELEKRTETETVLDAFPKGGKGVFTEGFVYSLDSHMIHNTFQRKPGSKPLWT